MITPDDDIMSYKKKAKKKTNKKSDHKHQYAKCTVEYPKRWWDKNCDLNNTTKDIGEYCTICGKIKTISFWTNETTIETPTFYLKDPFDKYVELEETENV